MFGHPGAGGQFGYGDSSTKLGVGYTSKYMDLDPKSFENLPSRFANLLYATYDCINALEGESVKRKAYMSLGPMENDRRGEEIKINWNNLLAVQSIFIKVHKPCLL